MNGIEESSENLYPENLTYGYARSQEIVEKEWQRSLEMDFMEKIQRIKDGPGEKYGWVFPVNALEIFLKYFDEFEATTIAKYQDNPTVETNMCDIDTGEEYFESGYRWVKEVYPLVYELRDSSILKFPKPEIPFEYLTKAIKTENANLGLVPFPQLSEKPDDQSREYIPKFKDEKIKPGAVRYILLIKMFEESDELKSLSIKKKEQIIGFILGLRADTAKNYKNATSKYINIRHEEEAGNLLEKIKKGDIL